MSVSDGNALRPSATGHPSRTPTQRTGRVTGKTVCCTTALRMRHSRLLAKPLRTLCTQAPDTACAPLARSENRAKRGYRAMVLGPRRARARACCKRKTKRDRAVLFQRGRSLNGTAWARFCSCCATDRNVRQRRKCPPTFGDRSPQPDADTAHRQGHRKDSVLHDSTAHAAFALARKAASHLVHTST